VFGMSNKRMIWLCRNLSTLLDAGVPVTRALSVLTSQAPAGRIRQALQRVAADVDAGATLAEAFEARGLFPGLFVLLVGVGEESGALERALAELVRFYEFQQRIRQTLIANLALPVIQYVVAVAVISLATHIITMLGLSAGSPVFYLCAGYGGPVAAIGLYFLLVKPLAGSRPCHEVLLRVPALGNVMRAVALARFSLVMYVMQEAGVPVTNALERAFNATGNAAFAARADAAVQAVEAGETLTDALRATGLFPRDFMEAVDVAEQSGKLSERFDWLASHYSRRAESALHTLAVVFSRLVYVAVALFIIYFIFKFFSLYAGAISGAMG